MNYHDQTMRKGSVSCSAEENGSPLQNHVALTLPWPSGVMYTLYQNCVTLSPVIIMRQSYCSSTIKTYTTVKGFFALDDP